MAYIKNTWVDQNVERPRTYELQNNTDGSVTFIDSFGNVTELGTPVNADNMNHIEEGIYAGSFTKYDANGVYEMNDLVTVIEDGSPVIYKSSQDDNKGNTLSDTTYWEKISLGGGGGLEIGDIGIAPLGIDETKGKRRYLNGQVIIQEQYVQFTNKVKSAVALYPSLACTESEWQTTATMTVGGQVGKFVVDDNAGTIRLPKIIMPIQGLTDLSKLAEIVEAGLPNITGNTGNIVGYSNQNGSGAMSGRTNTASANLSSGSLVTTANIPFDASLSNPTYGNSNTVQQEQIQYPYFIQVATGAETEDNIINEIELNNPFSLLDYKYSEYELNNLSWLRSNGQYNSKAVYPAVYDLLLKIYNGTETKAGVSVKLSTGSYTDTDFVLNTSTETFRLPLKVKLASGKAVAGNGMTLGLTDGTHLTGLTQSSNPYALYRATQYGEKIGNNATISYPTVNKLIGVTTDPTKSGLELSDNDLYLYFYVGETVQNANLINAGRIEEKLTLKADKTDVDGQWVYKFLQLGTDLSFNSANDQIFDLTDYLPNDGYNYEIIVCIHGRSGTSSGNNIDLGIFSDIIPLESGGIRFGGAITRTSNFAFGSGALTMPIGTGRLIGLHQNSTSSCTNTQFRAFAYRRIGKNF